MFCPAQNLLLSGLTVKCFEFYVLKHIEQETKFRPQHTRRLVWFIYKFVKFICIFSWGWVCD